jgi:hypothetical protein
MTKRRASIRGRGAEILFGEPAEVEIQPRAPDRVEEPGAHEPEFLEPGAHEPWADEPPDTRLNSSADALQRADLSQTPPTTIEIETPPEWEVEEIEEALRAEALDGAPRSLARGVVSVVDLEPPLTADMEVAFIEEAYAAGPPPEPVAEVPVPTMEETVEERTLDEDVAMMYEPPPPEVGSVTSGVVPPRPERRFLEMQPELAQARDIQAPEKKVELIILPERPLTPEERAEIVERLGEGWIEALQSQIDAAYESVRRLVGENETVAVDAYNTLLKARDILVMRKIDQLAQAEYYLELVRARMKRVSASEAAAKKYQWRILGWGMLWGIAFLVLLILLGQDWFRAIVAPAGSADSLIELDIFISAMLWGGIGGSVAVLYSLFKHVGERDFDSQFLVSYVGKPFLGFISGAIVYMALNLVVRAVGILAPGMQTGAGETASVVAPGVVYLVALAAGFKEARLLGLIDSLWDQIFGKEEEEKEEEILEPAPTA